MLGLLDCLASCGLSPMPGQSRWHDLYNSRRWQHRAKAQLREYPLCAMCLERKVTTPVAVADHVTPHKGDAWLFQYGELQSLCAHCHSHRKKRHETHGYLLDIGTDGWPIDPNHPANRRS
jgi:5-methylcytosine-specific restriction enzyme A